MNDMLHFSFVTVTYVVESMAVANAVIKWRRAKERVRKNNTQRLGIS
jgi:hypothetical protein